MKKFMRWWVSFIAFLALALVFANQAQAQTILFTQDWETAAIGATPPASWGVDLVSGSNAISFQLNGTWPTCSPYSGSRMVEFASFNYGTGTENRLKMTAPISTVGYDTITVDLRWLTDPDYAGVLDRVNVQWSTNGSSWTTAATFYRYAATQAWTLQAVSLPAGAANQPTLYIAFDFISAFGNNCHLDLVHIKGMPIPLHLPFAEDWEAAAVGVTPPTNWGMDAVVGSNYTGFVSAGYLPTCTPYSGIRMVEFGSWNAGAGTENRLKMTTPVTTVGYNSIAVDFRWLTDPDFNGFSDRVNVQWSTNGTTWSTASTIQRHGPIQAWTLQTVPLPAGAANQPTLYIAFDFISAFGMNCHLDLVHIIGDLIPKKNDFNGDGREDILWRNYGTGQNALWYIGPPSLSLIAQNVELSTMNAFDQVPVPGNVFWSAADVGSPSRPKADVVNFDPRGGSGMETWESLRAKGPVNSASVRTFSGVSGNGVKPLNIPTTSVVLLDTVADTNWFLVGTGDFNGDGKVDILWRNNTTGQNIIWLMNGATRAGSADLPSVTDPNWQIVGTGDFNADGKVDVLWRNISSGGNVVWLMDGMNYSSSVYLTTMPDPLWRIVGTGDFDRDGKVDILWRNATMGQNAVWYMNGTSYTGYAFLQPVADGNWLIMGAGDFNSDGKLDIIWRNVLTGQNAIWYLDGVTYLGYDLLGTVASYLWIICNR